MPSSTRYLPLISGCFVSIPQSVRIVFVNPLSRGFLFTYFPIPLHLESMIETEREFKEASNFLKEMELEVLREAHLQGKKREVTNAQQQVWRET